MSRSALASGSSIRFSPRPFAAGRAPAPVRILAGLVLPSALLLLWHNASTRGWAPPQILPAPAVAWSSFLDLLASGDLRTHVQASLIRVLISFALGSAAGLALGLAMGLSRRLDDLFGAVFHGINQVPTLGWLPVLIVVVGINDRLTHILIAQAVFVSVAINTQRGIRQVPERLVEVARAYRLSRTQSLRKVVLPAAVPQIFTGIRFGLANGWASLVVVELLVGSEGLGYLMSWGRQAFQLDLVLVAIVAVGIIGWILDAGLARLEGTFTAWRTGEAAA
ncbi:MAG: sulfonate transporter [Fibrobacteres bacterium]|nr:sulfonate transporter [Fibrobacterota bacterium]